MNHPTSLRDLFPEVLTDLVARCEPHPITDLPCQRRSCDGRHTADGTHPWADEENRND